VFPDGPWRPASGVQRGSAVFINLCPGDPRNPMCRVNASQTYKDFIPKIPTQPISYGDAIHLLRDLGNARQASLLPKKYI
jgi:N-acetylated-alpha-linked acidic dipeptidase